MTNSERLAEHLQGSGKLCEKMKPVTVAATLSHALKNLQRRYQLCARSDMMPELRYIHDQIYADTGRKACHSLSFITIFHGNKFKCPEIFF